MKEERYTLVRRSVLIPVDEPTHWVSQMTVDEPTHWVSQMTVDEPTHWVSQMTVDEPTHLVSEMTVVHKQNGKLRLCIDRNR